MPECTIGEKINCSLIKNGECRQNLNPAECLKAAQEAEDEAKSTVDNYLNNGFKTETHYSVDGSMITTNPSSGYRKSN